MKKYLISFIIIDFDKETFSSEIREVKAMTEHTLSFIRDEIKEKNKGKKIFIISFSEFD